MIKWIPQKSLESPTNRNRDREHSRANPGVLRVLSIINGMTFQVMEKLEDFFDKIKMRPESNEGKKLTLRHSHHNFKY